MFDNFLRDILKVSILIYTQIFLIYNRTLSPSVWRVQFIYIVLTIKSTSIVKIYYKFYILIFYVTLNSLNGFIFRVTLWEVCELSIHISIRSATAFNDTVEIKIWNYPERAFCNLIMCCQKWSRYKSTRLITLNTTNN